MKLESTFTIGNVNVEKTNRKFLGFSVYTPSHDHDDLTLFLVNSRQEVVGKIEATADCSQNVGYISNYSLVTIKG